MVGCNYHPHMAARLVRRLEHVVRGKVRKHGRIQKMPFFSIIFCFVLDPAGL